MNEEIQLFLEEAKELMDKAIVHFSAELAKIRAGKAMPNMLDGIMVDYYGAMTPIQQVASVNTPDARTLAIKPWEKNMISEIEKSIINSDLGLNPQNNGEMVMINVPPLTEERRKNLVKQVKAEAETAKVSVRNIRKDANESIRKLMKEGAAEDDVKRAEDEVQKLTDSHSLKIDKLVDAKEVEIMTV
ncbi:MAG: ribosome recycling factor [Imperialibacter sp.]|uniref:ribosome recycling factor n=1 Tax=Imperialibacter sp. TaxID=2038411 RepID=UPI003A8933A9